MTTFEDQLAGLTMARKEGAAQEREEIRLEVQRLIFNVEREIQRKEMLKRRGLHDTLMRSEGRISALQELHEWLKQREQEGS